MKRKISNDMLHYYAKIDAYNLVLYAICYNLDIKNCESNGYGGQRTRSN